MPERPAWLRGLLADPPPADTPRMMSGRCQDILDPAIRARLEQELGFGDDASLAAGCSPRPESR